MIGGDFVTKCFLESRLLKISNFFQIIITGCSQNIYMMKKNI